MEEVSQFLKTVETYIDLKGIDLVTAAAEFAEKSHHTFLRINHTPYFLHSVGVASLLSAWKAPPEVLAAALLHDVFKPKYAHQPRATELEKHFPPQVVSLVEDVTQLSGFGPTLMRRHISRDKLESASYRDHYSWAAVILHKNPVAVVIKIADRIQNLDSLAVLPPEKQLYFALSVLNVFAPLAERLGMRAASRILQDGCFRILHPEAYINIAAKVNEVSESEWGKTLVADLQQTLDASHLSAHVVPHVSHCFGIFSRQQGSAKRNVAPNDILSFFVLVNSEDDCFRALRLVHQLWRPLHEFYDYISAPKPNGYAALHTRVLALPTVAFRVCIQSERMNLVAEHGITARWQGVEEKYLPLVEPLPPRPADHFIFITPGGDVKYLPEGSTAVDFAYSIHPQVGHRSVQALVNGTPTSLELPLPDGAVVEIVLGRGKLGPNKDWLRSVMTHTAREAIEKWVQQQNEMEIIIEALDRVALLKDITDTISVRGINMLFLDARVLPDGKAIIRIGVRELDLTEIEELIGVLQDLPMVLHVERKELTGLALQAASQVAAEVRDENPYTLNPVVGRDFKGREREVQDIVNRLRGRHRGNPLLVWGQQRIGKTSLLWHLEHDVLQSPGSIIVYTSLQEVKGEPIGYFLHRIAYRIETKVQRADVKAPTLGKLKSEPISYFQRFIDRLEQVLGPQTLLILVDEIQEAATLREIGTTRLDVFSNFRSIMQTGVVTNFIFCGGGIYQEFVTRSGLSPLLSLLDAVKVEELDMEAAKALITEIEPSLEYTDDAVKRLLEVTQRHPCYLKYLCNRLYQSRTQPKITLIDVEKVLDQSIRWAPTLEGMLEHFWKMGLDSVEGTHKLEQFEKYKLILLEVAKGENSSRRITFDRLAEHTSKYIDEPELPILLKHLTDYGSLEESNANYHIHLPLLEYWLRRTVS